MSATKIGDDQTTRLYTPDGRWRHTTIQRLHDMGVQSDTPSDTPPDEPPATDGMGYGGNFPMQFGWTTEKFEIRADGTLHPAFVHDMRIFDFANRYMECMRTNGSSDVTVADMEKPKSVWDAWPDGSGVPISYVARHARLLGIRPWVCVPHLADDELVAHMATECAGLYPIVEVSNELHTTNMAQSKWAADQSGISYTTGPQQRQAAYAWASKRLGEIKAIWQSIDPDAEFVFAMSQNDPPDNRDLYAPFDAISPNAYFGMQLAWSGSQWEHHKQDTAQELIAWLGGEAIDMMVEQIAARVAEADGKPVWPYEGGPHVWSDNRGNPAILEALKEPSIETVYRRYLAGLEAAGCGAVMHYMTCQGRNTNPFGLKEYTGQPESEVGAYRAFIR